MSDIVSLDTDINLFGDEIAQAALIDREPLARALFAQLRDITLEQFVGLLTNHFDAVIEYAGLCAGERAGQRISLLFNPHRLDTCTASNSASLYQSLKNDKFMRGLARVVLVVKKQSKKDVLYASLGMGINGVSYVDEFQPYVARNLALEYGLNKHCHVLDPCAGWGGRMLGFSAVVNRYTCCEPSTRTIHGLQQLERFIQSFRSDFHATLHALPFEDVSLPDDHFDFAMTSPPYFDTERYAPNELTNAGNRYATFDAWCDGFYAPLIHRTMAALKPGAVFVLNIGSRKYPLNERLFTICKDRYDVSKQRARLVTGAVFGRTGEGETFYEIRKSGTLQLPADVELPASTAAPVAAERDDACGDDVSFDTAALDAPAAPQAAHETFVTAAIPALDLLRSLNATVERAQDAINHGASAVELAHDVNTIIKRAQHELAAVVPEVVKITARDVIAQLEAKGCRIFDKRGNVAVSNASRMTDDERALLKEHKSAILVLVPPFPEPTEAAATSLIQFLGEQPRPVETWQRESLPTLDGVTEIELDFESTGLKWRGKRDKPIGFALRWNGRSKYFPTAHEGYADNIDENVAKRFFHEQVKYKRITNAYIGFDIHLSREWDVDLVEQGCEFSDVMHYAALLDDHRKRFALNELAKDYLGREKAGMDLDPTRMASYTPAEVARRAEGDVDTVAELKAAMWPQLDAQDLQRVRALEDQVIPIVCEMEKNGAPIDMPLFERMSRDAKEHYERLIGEIGKEAGFNFDDTQSSWQRLLESCKLPPIEFKAKRPKDSLLSRIEHPIIKKARFAAQLDSLRSKVFNAYPSIIENGVLYFELHQLRIDDAEGKRGTVSGRFSAPYIQQVPNKDNHSEVFGDLYFPRELYVPGAGLLLAGDAAQIEYRIFAGLAKNPRVLEAYLKNPRMSFHKFMWPIIQQYKKDLAYTGMKNFNFMRIYGGGLVKTAVMMGFITEKEGDEITDAHTEWTDPRLASAREIDGIYNREMPEVKPLLKRAMHLAMSKCKEPSFAGDRRCCNKGDELHRRFKHRGYVKTTLGRRSRFPNDYKIHKALNAVIQGSAADIMKTKLVEVYKERKALGMTMRMTIHDEIVGDVPDVEQASKVSAILNQQSFDLPVPILWEVGTGKNWAEAK